MEIKRSDGKGRHRIVWKRKNTLLPLQDLEADLFDLLIPVIRRRVAKKAAGRTVYRVWLFYSYGSGQGSLPPLIAIDDAGKNDPYPTSDSFDLTEELEDDDRIMRACEPFNLHDVGAKPGIKTRRFLIELAKRLNAMAQLEGFVPAPGFLFCASDIEGAEAKANLRKIGFSAATR